MTAPRVIAIDGPAASGKSSTADAVAHALGFVHIDSGALYRALTWVATADQAETASDIQSAAESRHVALRFRAHRIDVHIDGVDDVDAAIRSPAVNASVSAIAAMPSLRDWVNQQIGALLALLPGAVIDGRDIGTVVVPTAGLKVFLTASPAARATRRLLQRGGAVDPAEVIAEAARLAARDLIDSSRSVAPLRPADDAEMLDSSDLSFREQVDRIVGMAHARGW